MITHEGKRSKAKPPLFKKPTRITTIRMSRIRGTNSRMERAFERALWKRSLSYRKQLGIFGRPDFVLPEQRIAIFCDSTFWHGYRFRKTKRHSFKRNAKFWIYKIEKNMNRDKVVNRTLRMQGWTVVRFWDFEIRKNVERCVDKIEQIIKSSC